MKDSNIPFQKTLIQSSTITDKENNDCVVRAIASAFDIDYLIAWSILANNGRKVGKGTYSHTSRKVITILCEKLGYTQTAFRPIMKMRATDIAVANKNNPQAIILMFTKRHLTLFKDGKLQDTFIDTNYVSEFITISKLNKPNQEHGNLNQRHDYGTTEQIDSRTIGKAGVEIIFKF